MSKAPSPLLGYNNNVRHKNRVFHIQTEDSGIKHPHVITHLFMDGGRILKSVKTSYAEHVGNDKLGDVVRQMMKDQHKAMFKALRDGEFDKLVDDALAGRRPSLMPPAAPRVEAPRAPALTLSDEATAPPTVRQSTGDQPAMTLDLDALPTAGKHFRPEADLPPPPANLFRDRTNAEPGTGRYRTLEEPEPHAKTSASPKQAVARAKSERPPPRSERPPRPAPRSERPPRAAPRTERGPVREEKAHRPDPRAEPPSEPKQPVATQSSRPGPGGAARPAAIFGQARPQQASIFGEDIISDKSLDEVILSYLAEDLEEGK